MEKNIGALILSIVFLCIGQYIPTTFMVFGITIHWSPIILLILILFLLIKKFCRFLWNKLIQALKNELV